MAQIVCQCGCGEKAYHNQMTLVTVEVAEDESLRQTKRKSFLVIRSHKEGFEEELGMMTQLAQLVRAYANQPFWSRIWRVRTVIRLQHAIHERVRGFSEARQRALASGILFAVPKWLQPFVFRHFDRKAKRHAAQAHVQAAAAQA